MSFSACLRSCLSICLPSGFVFHLGWGAVSASLGLSAVLSPNLSPIWLCLPICFPSGFVFSPWLGCCVRLAGLVCGLVSQFVSHLALIWLCLSPWLGCCVRLAGLVSGLVSQCVSQFVSHLALSPSFVSPFVLWLCLSPWLGCCVRLVGLVFNLFAICLCLSPWLGRCVRLAGLVSQFVFQLVSPHFVFHLLCPPPWACLLICLPICLPSGFVFHLGWDAVSASLVLSLSCPWSCLPAFVFVLSRSLSFIWDAVSAPTICRDLRRPTIL